MFLGEFLTVAVVHLLAVISPGPDFVMISRNSLVYSRQVGVYSAIGLAFGILGHVTYSLVGLALIISKSILLFSILKYVGAAYLVYMGWQCLRARPPKSPVSEPAERTVPGKLAAIRIGFLTNALNPKATLLFFALFTQVISPRTPKSVQMLYGLEMAVMTFVWFALVAVILSHRRVKKPFLAVQHYLERTFGVILIALGMKVALSSSK